MLHEILLSLSGHSSPLLREGRLAETAQPVLSPPERDLLKTAAHLSELHRSLIKTTAQINASHGSVICRAVSNAVGSIHLAAFQRKILEVESSILRKDAALVGAYDIVPLTAVVGEFSDWTMKMEWLWDIVQFMLKKDKGGLCTGSQLMDKLRSEIQTGYADIEAAALSLARVAETAWLKQVSAWVLYGRLPSFGAQDFFIQLDAGSDHGFRVDAKLLPAFVNASTVSSMLFIGTSLNHVRSRAGSESSVGGLGHLSSQLQELSSLTFPLDTAAFSRAITSIRQYLSQTTLQKLLPREKVVEMLHLLREFFLLGRGEFAMALTQQADEKLRNRWHRADNLAYEKRDKLGTAVVKEGEVAAVLSRAWAVLASMQSEHADEDEELERARDLIQLSLAKSGATNSAEKHDNPSTVSTPFGDLLFSVPVIMSLHIPSPLDLFLSTADVATYSSINSYLLSIRRAHLRLTDLWKITSLRRHHPAPPRPPFSQKKAGQRKTRTLRDRWSERSLTMRSTWTTSSAAIFFLAETEAYLQVEIVEGLWDHFQGWLVGREASGSRPSTSHQQKPLNNADQQPDEGGDDDSWLTDGRATRPASRQVPQSGLNLAAHRDPQTLSIAHRMYLSALTRRLLLTQLTFTDPLYRLLVHIDRLVALVHRLQSIWTALDLEADEGVVDAFSNLEAEEAEIKAHIGQVENKVKKGVEDVVGVLRNLSIDSKFLADMEGEEVYSDTQEFLNDEPGRYIPKRVGGVDRLLMKLDFGGWFNSGIGAEHD
ncbi:Gamma-tubulin complex component 4 [Apiospora arundinis]|uniref:Spindle pole body component n=1 Tax=Apiospora arundinis TaxID=335852 RepID=A0ABR2IW67_9PEZI